MAISLAFLAPDLVEAAIDGRLPRGIGIARLSDLPAEWSQQPRRVVSTAKDTRPECEVAPTLHDDAGRDGAQSAALNAWHSRLEPVSYLGPGTPPRKVNFGAETTYSLEQGIS